MQTLPIDSIKQKDSLFYFYQPLAFTPSTTPYHQLLLKQPQMLSQPILVYEKDAQYHLVNGFLRLAYAKQNQQTHVECEIITQPIEQILHSLFIEKFDFIQKTLINRVSFLHCLNHFLPRQTIIDEYLPLLNLEAHEKMLRQCESIAKLPDTALLFCLEKNFSKRQCLAIVKQPPELVLEVLQWREHLNITASILEELLTHLKDLLKIKNCLITDLKQQLNLDDILLSDANNNEKTKKIRLLIRQQRYPQLTQIQQQLLDLKKTMNLPSNLNIKWDDSLEQKKLDLLIRITKSTELNNINQYMNTPIFEQNLTDLLNHL